MIFFSAYSVRQLFTNKSSVIDILQRVMKAPGDTMEELLTTSMDINEVGRQI